MILFTCMNSKDANNKSYMYKDNFKMHSRVAEQLVGQLHQHQSILDLIQSDLFHEHVIVNEDTRMKKVACGRFKRMDTS